MQIVVLVYDHMLATSIGMPMEMLRAAEDAAISQGDPRNLEIILASTSLAPAVTKSGLPVTPSCLLNDIEKAPDLIYIPAMWRNPKPVVQRHHAICDWLEKQAAQGTLISAAGTGACFLAEAGLLDDRPATTHWYYFDRFAQDYPQVDLKREYFITRSENLYCAGSINALADLTIYFIEHFYDKAIASHVERHFSHEIRQPWENRTYLDENRNRHHDEAIIQGQLWMHNNFGMNVSLLDVATHCDMSLRNFNRRFRLATNKSPLEYLQEIRMNHARELLKNSNVSIAEIADKVGYPDASHFSSLFRKLTQITPREYRKTVRKKMFTL